MTAEIQKAQRQKAEVETVSDDAIKTVFLGKLSKHVDDLTQHRQLLELKKASPARDAHCAMLGNEVKSFF